MMLLEHEAAKRLAINQLEGVDWLPADVRVAEVIKNSLY